MSVARHPITTTKPSVAVSSVSGTCGASRGRRSHVAAMPSCSGQTRCSTCACSSAAYGKSSNPTRRRPTHIVTELDVGIPPAIAARAAGRNCPITFDPNGPAATQGRHKIRPTAAACFRWKRAKRTIGHVFVGEPAGIRTRDLLIKSQLLYRLSYGLGKNARFGVVPAPVRSNQCAGWRCGHRALSRTGAASARRRCG